MSKHRTTKLACPNCSQEQDLTIWDSVNVTLKPELKPKVLNQELLRPRCSTCLSLMMLSQPLLYHDARQQFMVSLAGPPEANHLDPKLGDYRLRTVQSNEHLVEKILIFDAGLDDRAIELLKHGICHELSTDYGDALSKMNALPINPGYLIYIGTSASDHDSQLNFMIPLLGKLPGALLRTKLETYHEAKRVTDRLPSITPDDVWHTIDFHWAQRLFGGHSIASEIELLFSPEFILQHPIARSILERHLEMIATRRK